jgi:hypothetical protein
VYGILTTRMYKQFYSVFDSRIVVKDLIIDEPNFANILNVVFLWCGLLHI